MELLANIRSFFGVTCVCVMLGTPMCQRPERDGQPPPPAGGNGVAQNAEDERLAHGVKRVVLKYCRYRGEASQAKEVISAIAAVVGERTIEAAGEYSARGHKFEPGQRVFSDYVNVLLTGDTGTDDISSVPGNSVFGALRDQLAGSRFQRKHFPPITEVFRGFAARIGEPEDWGKVPLSLPPEHWPGKLPLRVAFDTRPGVDAALGAVGEKKLRSLRICTRALALLLQEVGNDLDPAVALALALETVNGMAKTAPMYGKAIDRPSASMREAQHTVRYIEHLSPKQPKFFGDPDPPPTPVPAIAGPSRP